MMLSKHTVVNQSDTLLYLLSKQKTRMDKSSRKTIFNTRITVTSIKLSCKPQINVLINNIDYSYMQKSVLKSINMPCCVLLNAQCSLLKYSLRYNVSCIFTTWLGGRLINVLGDDLGYLLRFILWILDFLNLSNSPPIQSRYIKTMSDMGTAKLAK